MKFFYKLGRTVTETHDMLIQVYRTEAMRKKICLWVVYTLSRWEGNDWGWWVMFGSSINMQKLSHDGRSVTHVGTRSLPDATIDSEIVKELGISKDIVYRIIHEDLEKGKICSWFMLNMLTDDQKAKQMEIHENLTTVYNQDSIFLLTIFTENETWCSRRQSMNCCSISLLPKKRRLQKSKVKIRQCSSSSSTIRWHHLLWIFPGWSHCERILQVSFETVGWIHPTCLAWVAQDWTVDIVERKCACALCYHNAPILSSALRNCSRQFTVFL